MSKKSRSDLLVRVRYVNPLPGPPFPPKLFSIPTNIHRLGDPAFLDEYAASIPIPMLVDSEMGMPVDLNAHDWMWYADEDVSSIPPLPLEPEDIALLEPLRTPGANGNGVAGPSSAPEVSWMRNSALFTRKAPTRRKDVKPVIQGQEIVDTSEAAQIMAIEDTFLEIDSDAIETMTHPENKRRHARVIESYDILPEEDVWSNLYILVRYPETPSAATSTNPSAKAQPRQLGRAILRPIMEDDQQIMQYLLPESEALEALDEAYHHPLSGAELDDFKGRELEADSKEASKESVHDARFQQIRTYEVVSQVQPEKEILLTLVEDGGEESSAGKAAYYKDVGMRTLLRKTRAQRDMQVRDDLWDGTRVQYRVLDPNEVEAREGVTGMIGDPNWVSGQMRILRGANELEGLGEAQEE